MPKPDWNSNTPCHSFNRLSNCALNLPAHVPSRPLDWPSSLLKTPCSQDFTLLSSYKPWPNVTTLEGPSVTIRPPPHVPLHLSFPLSLCHSYLHLDLSTSLLLTLYCTCIHVLLLACSNHWHRESKLWTSLTSPRIATGNTDWCWDLVGEQYTHVASPSEWMNPHHFLPLSSPLRHPKWLSCWNSCLFGGRALGEVIWRLLSLSLQCEVLLEWANTKVVKG